MFGRVSFWTQVTAAVKRLQNVLYCTAISRCTHLTVALFKVWSFIKPCMSMFYKSQAHTYRKVDSEPWSVACFWFPQDQGFPNLFMADFCIYTLEKTNVYCGYPSFHFVPCCNPLMGPEPWSERLCLRRSLEWGSSDVFRQVQGSRSQRGRRLFGPTALWSNEN